MVKWIPIYLRGTSNTCIEYGRNNDGFYGYMDSDYGGDLDEGKPTLVFVFYLGGSTFSWKSKLQGVGAQLTIELEYIAITEGYNLSRSLMAMRFCG